MPAGHVQVAPDSTGKDVDADSITSTESGTPTVYRQNVIVADPANYSSKARVFAPGQQRVTMDPAQLFLDTFDASLDTAARWAAPAASGTGAIAATWSAGQVLLTGGTAANAYSVLTSQPAFVPDEPGWLQITMRINIEFPVLSNSYRFWGLAITPASPTIAAPVTEGAGWEVSTTGAFAAVTYAAGTRTQIATVTAPGNSAPHKYFLFFRGDLSYWAIDDPDNVVASFLTGASGPNVNTLPLKALVVSNAGTAATIQLNGVSVGDTARNNISISDDTYPWRQAAVGRSGGLAVRGALPAVQTLAVSAGTPVTGAALDVSEAGNVTFIVKNTVAGTAFTGTPVIVFEQSDDGTSWAPLPVTSTSLATSSAPAIAAGAANAEQMFDAGVEGVNWVRARVTTAPAANGMTVVIQPGGMPFNPAVSAVAPAPVTGTLSSVAGTVSSTTLLAANANRKGGTAFNDSSANLYLGFTSSAVSTSSYTVKIPPGGFFEFPWPVYAGQVNGIWDAAAGNVRITELT